MKELVKLDLYCGMLGSGKTTMINQMLKTTYAGHRTAIVENEIGAVNLDSELFRQAEVTVRTVTSGCICCTVKGDFSESIRILIDQMHPEYIILEPSGMADLPKVLNACREAKDAVVNRVVLMLNSRRVRALLAVTGPFFEAQIRTARYAYMNFSDTLSEEKLADAREAVLSVNPGLKLVEKPLCELSGDDFPEGDPCNEEMLPKLPDWLSAKGGSGREAGLSKMRPQSRSLTEDTITLQFFSSFTEEQYQTLKERLERDLGDTLWRAKGYLRMTDGTIRKTDYVQGDWYEEKEEVFPYEKTNLLVLIGKEIPVRKAGEIRKLVDP